ncbi:protein kinase [Streptomyces sp. NPDC058469]|uniref:serine/threonine-protein kinase n=1 Tax=Streptomyces sp. NPDC058469 TaxID=3346514 RepID=UPI00365E7A87
MEKLGAADPQRIGAYRLLARLGTGGMGHVYLARSDRGRTVAVKLVREELAAQEEFRARFRQEVRAARRVGGHWTAPVLDADTEAEVPWVATGYVAGPTLQQVVGRDRGALPERSVRILAAGLAHALQDIHAAGIVHRDLKPSNVLVTIDGPRVIDFGIARALETQAGDGLTRTGSLVGSPGFMAPEQVRGDRITPACDVFCLGSVLAYAATGTLPFGTANSGVHALMFRIAQEEPDLSGVPEGIADLVHDCLRKDPATRPTLHRILDRTGAEDTVSGGRSRDPWLPGALVAQLGRHAVQLLDTEDPETTELERVDVARVDAERADSEKAALEGGGLEKAALEKGGAGRGVPGRAAPGRAAPGTGDLVSGGLETGDPDPQRGNPQRGDLEAGSSGPVGSEAEGSDAVDPETVQGAAPVSAAAPTPAASAPVPTPAPVAIGKPDPFRKTPAAPEASPEHAPASDDSSSAPPAPAAGAAPDDHLPTVAADPAGSTRTPPPQPPHPAYGYPQQHPQPSAAYGDPQQPNQPSAPGSSQPAAQPSGPYGDPQQPNEPSAYGASRQPAQPPAAYGNPQQPAQPSAANGYAQPPAPPSPADAYPQPPGRQLIGWGGQVPYNPYPHNGGLGATPPYGPGPVGVAPPYGEPQPPRRNGRSTALLVVVALVVALGAGGSVYALMKGGGNGGRTKAGSGGQATSAAPTTPGPSTGEPTPSRSPSPSATPAGDGAVPSGYLGTWNASIDNATGHNTRQLTIRQGKVGAPVLTLVADGPGYHCEFTADLAQEPGGESPLAIGASTVTSGKPLSSCNPGSATEITLLSDRTLQRVNTDSGEKLTYTKSG